MGWKLCNNGWDAKGALEDFEYSISMPVSGLAGAAACSASHSLAVPLDRAEASLAAVGLRLRHCVFFLGMNIHVPMQ